ncbi:NADH pyrophosphatase [Methanosarcinaceae archaeon Ag5]|uniref:NAD(+) diphosphatase n=1 Tax=Methanolapillus africanus TaxID=3028297 RepID=A0AAE4MK00_9EURY|nr:NADH pyrophosphatase [Methanosarcinaceae archaeon Ag5]
MIQDIAPHRFNNQYCPQPPTAESCGLCYDKNTILVRKNEDGTFDLPTFQELEAENADIYQIYNQLYTYLFSIDDQTFYLMNQIKPPEGFTWEPIHHTMAIEPHHLSFAAVTGYQLYNWYECRKYCGRCGAVMLKNGKSRSLSCPSCQQTEYPKIAPAVIVGVTNGNRLLLAKYPRFDRYALIAGFAEIGETFEETVEREVMEEAGLKVKNIRYYKSQPWSLSDNLLAGFFCDVDAENSDPNKIVIDASELLSAEWFEREDIPVREDPNGSLTFEMMYRFKIGKI